MRRPCSTSSISSFQSSCMVWKLSCGVCVNAEWTMASRAWRMSSNEGRRWGSGYQQAVTIILLHMSVYTILRLASTSYFHEHGKESLGSKKSGNLLPIWIISNGVRSLLTLRLAVYFLFCLVSFLVKVHSSVNTYHLGTLCLTCKLLTTL
jgi:hypothetical protein